MLVLSVLVNTMSAANILLLDSFNSGVVVCCVAVVQLIITYWLESKNKEISLVIKILFLILYLIGGLMGYHSPIDLLSTVAAVFYMIAMLQKKEQNIRLMLLVNMSLWTVYHSILGSTAVFAQIAGIISSLIALYRYRNKSKKSE